MTILNISFSLSIISKLLNVISFTIEIHEFTNFIDKNTPSTKNLATISSFLLAEYQDSKMESLNIFDVQNIPLQRFLVFKAFIKSGSQNQGIKNFNNTGGGASIPHVFPTPKTSMITPENWTFPLEYKSAFDSTYPFLDNNQFTPTIWDSTSNQTSPQPTGQIFWHFPFNSNLTVDSKTQIQLIIDGELG